MSAGSPNQGERLRSLRPWFLVAAMILTWLAGVQGVTNGCGTIFYLRDGSMPDGDAALEEAKSASDKGQGFYEYVKAENMRAVAAAKPVMMPLSIGQVLLSTLLVAASAMVLAGRPGSRTFAVQVIAANAVLAIVAYALTQEMREQWIAAVVRGSREIELPPQKVFGITFFDLSSQAAWVWASRVKLAVFEVGLLAVAGLAILSRRTGLFLEAVARADERREREDEP